VAVSLRPLSGTDVAKTTVNNSPSISRPNPAAGKVLEALFASINPNVLTPQALYKGTRSFLRCPSIRALAFLKQRPRDARKPDGWKKGFGSIRISGFDLLSDFGFRVSDFEPAVLQPQNYDLISPSYCTSAWKKRSCEPSAGSATTTCPNGCQPSAISLLTSFSSLVASVADAKW